MSEKKSNRGEDPKYISIRDLVKDRERFILSGPAFQRDNQIYVPNPDGVGLPPVPFDPDDLSSRERADLLFDWQGIRHFGKTIEEIRPGHDPLWYADRLTRIAAFIQMIERGWKPKREQDARD